MARVQVRNDCPFSATGVRVHFGVHVYSAAVPTFHDIGTRIVDFAAGETKQVEVSWVPANEDHQCLKTEIAWGQDSDFTNNLAQRNLKVAQSPVLFEVRNTLTEDDALIEIEPTLEVVQGPPAEAWVVEISDPALFLTADDCPQEVEVLVTPPAGAAEGDTALAHVAARIGTEVLGGVTVRQCLRSVCTEAGSIFCDGFECGDTAGWSHIVGGAASLLFDRGGLTAAGGAKASCRSETAIHGEF